MELKKGDYIKATRDEISLAHIAGVNVKLNLNVQSYEGQVIHLYSDSPIEAVNLSIVIRTKDNLEVFIKPEWVTEINGNKV